MKEQPPRVYGADGHQARRLAEALQLLDDEERDIVQRVIVFDESVESVAEALGIDAAEVKRIKNAGIKKLKELMA